MQLPAQKSCRHRRTTMPHVETKLQKLPAPDLEQELGEALKATAVTREGVD